MNQIDLSQLSADELEELQEKAAKRLKVVRHEERIAAFAKIDDFAKSLGLTRADLAAHYGAKKRVNQKPPTPKYRNPGDPTQTWSGRGRKPAWVAEYLEQGGKLQELRIAS